MRTRSLKVSATATTCSAGFRVSGFRKAFPKREREKVSATCWRYWGFNEHGASATHAARPWTHRRDATTCGSGSRVSGFRQASPKRERERKREREKETERKRQRERGREGGRERERERERDREREIEK